MAMELTPVARRFILHWGEMGTSWGVNRTVAQIHALLFMAGRPMHAEEITETLSVARSNVSGSLRELANWNLIRTVHLLGDRRDHFETTTDVWELFNIVVRERKTREFDPTIAVLRDCLNNPEFSREDAGAQMRIRETLKLMETLSAWADEMLRLNPETMVKVLKLGAKVQQFVRKPDEAKVDVPAPVAPDLRYALGAKPAQHATAQDDLPEQTAVPTTQGRVAT